MSRSSEVRSLEKFGLGESFQMDPAVPGNILRLVTGHFTTASSRQLIAEEGSGERIRARGGMDPESTQLDIWRDEQGSVKIKRSYNKPHLLSTYGALLAITSKTFLLEPRKHKPTSLTVISAASAFMVEKGIDYIDLSDAAIATWALREECGVGVKADNPEQLTVFHKQKAARMREGLRLVASPIASMLRLDVKFAEITDPNQDLIPDHIPGVELL